MRTERKEAETQDLLALIEDLPLPIKNLTGEIDTLKSEITELNLNMNSRPSPMAKSLAWRRT